MGASALLVGPDLSLPRPNVSGISVLSASGGPRAGMGPNGQTPSLGLGISIGMDQFGRAWISCNDPSSSIHILAGSGSVGLFLDSTVAIQNSLILTALGGSNPTVSAGANDSGGAGFRLLRIAN